MASWGEALGETVARVPALLFGSHVSAMGKIMKMHFIVVAAAALLATTADARNLTLTEINAVHQVREGRDTFRYSPVWLLPEPLELRSGEHFTIQYRYRIPGDDDRVTVIRT